LENATSVVAVEKLLFLLPVLLTLPGPLLRPTLENCPNLLGVLVVSLSDCASGSGI